MRKLKIKNHKNEKIMDVKNIYIIRKFILNCMLSLRKIQVITMVIETIEYKQKCCMCNS